MRTQFDEIWRPVTGYEGLYEVSSEGRVRSLNYRGVQGMIGYLEPKPNSKGYRVVYLYKNGRRKGTAISHIMAEAFIPNPENKPFVDHIVPISNGGTDVLSNLRWVTHEENMNNPMSKKNASVASKNADHSKLKGRRAWNKGMKGFCKGKIPWNKGVKGCFTEEALEKIRQSRKGKTPNKKKPMVLT